MNREVEQKIGQVLKTFTALPIEPSCRSIGGSSLNSIYQFALGDVKFFCKKNSANKFPQLFEKERKGLAFLKLNSGLKIPSVIDCFTLKGDQVLLLEWIEAGEKTDSFWKTFGCKMAEMHQVNADSFGWEENNFMGLVPQSNRNHLDWSEFFIEERLEPLCTTSLRKNLMLPGHKKLFDNLYKKLPLVFGNSQKPVLVHGDLWSGNFMADKNGEPVLIDPAVYFGHPAVDLGMSTLFGGFDKLFYESYHYHSPLPQNAREQWKVANLYPLLIHLLLFGQNYLPQIEQTLLEFE